MSKNVRIQNPYETRDDLHLDTSESVPLTEYSSLEPEVITLKGNPCLLTKAPHIVLLNP